MMIRALAIGVVSTVLASGAASLGLGLAGWPNATVPNPATVGDWPVCTSMASIGPDADWAQLDPDFAAGKKALANGKWQEAISALQLAALRDPRNADLQNYLGYAYWRMRRFGLAMGHYQRAVILNPRHRSAYEHLGELYLALGEPAQAEQQLAHLEAICLIPCREYDDLKRAIAAHGRLVAR